MSIALSDGMAAESNRPPELNYRRERDFDERLLEDFLLLDFDLLERLDLDDFLVEDFFDDDFDDLLVGVSSSSPTLNAASMRFMSKPVSSATRPERMLPDAADFNSGSPTEVESTILRLLSMRFAMRSSTVLRAIR